MILNTQFIVMIGLTLWVKDYFFNDAFLIILTIILY